MLVKELNEWGIKRSKRARPAPSSYSGNSVDGLTDIKLVIPWEAAEVKIQLKMFKAKERKQKAQPSAWI